MTKRNPPCGFLVLPGSDEEVALDRPANGRSYSLAECQAMVGGYIEVAKRDSFYGEVLVALANEEGLLNGLPYNAHASELCGVKLVGPVAFIPTSQFK